VLGSAVFDVLTLVRVHRRSAVGAVLRGWRQGLRGMPAQRGARTSGERRQAARRMVSLRVAIREHVRLRRL
jgi:hypothetical protein